MPTLRPRAVSPSAWRLWLREALALTRRQLPLVMAFALVYVLALSVLRDALWVTYHLATLGALNLVLTLFYLCAFILLAEAADRPWEVLAWLLRRLTTLALPLALIAAIMVTAFAAVIFIGAGLLTLAGEPPPLATAPGENPDSPMNVPGASLLGGLCLLLLPCMVGAWFVLPLVVCTAAPLQLAWRLAADAWLLNRFIWRIAAVWLLLAALLPGPAALVVGPLLGAMLYVSFRHVFLGQAENTARRAAAAVGANPALAKTE